MGLLVFMILGLLIGLVLGSQLSVSPKGGLPGVIGLTGGLFGGTGAAVLVGMDPLTQAWSLLAWVGAIGMAVVFIAFYALISTPGAAPVESLTGSGDRSTSGRGPNLG